MRVEHLVSSTKLQKGDAKLKVRTTESSANRDFETLLIEAVDTALSSLGDSSKQAIYFCLKEEFAIAKQDIPTKIEEFTNALEMIFGQGAKVIEIQIMRQLHEKVGYDFRCFPEKGNLFFNDYVQATRTQMSRVSVVTPAF
jgi:hypothetical protein